jgi:selenocysteine lyase/cysteine desulfurase
MLNMEHSRSQALGQKRHTYDAQSTPPPFGHALLDYFGFNPAYVNLNHGAYGSLPLPVKSVLDKLSDEIEWNPDLFHKFTYLERLQEARRGVAGLVGAKAEEIVIVENTSAGLNVILRNFAWNKGDILIGGA